QTHEVEEEKKGHLPVGIVGEARTAQAQATRRWKCRPAMAMSTHLLDPDLAHRIAKCAIDHYDDALPSGNGGKPQAGREWTVYAAIVACRTPNGEARSCSDEHKTYPETWVVSCATGSKCTAISSVVSAFPTPSGDTPSRNECMSVNITRSEKDGLPQVDLDDETIRQCYSGMILKDSHAETLARRGLMVSLWEEIETYLQTTLRRSGGVPPVSDGVTVKHRRLNVRPRNLLETRQGTSGPTPKSSYFRLKRDITLHMYVSDSPCGDSTIYEIRKTKKSQLSPSKANTIEVDSELNFTGAKIILTGCENEKPPANNNISSILSCSTNPGPNNETDTRQSTFALGREYNQIMGALRIKSSRSNIPDGHRSKSMSCSDKLVRWGVLGLQGSLLSTYIPEPICLSSICVSKDPRSVDGGSYGGQCTALERAISGRIDRTLEALPKSFQEGLAVKPPKIAVVNCSFESSKSASENRYLKSQTSKRKRNAIEKNCGADQHSPNKRTQTHDHASNDPETSPAPKAKKESASGMSINWHQNCSSDETDGKATEITIGATGLKRGKRPKTPKHVLRSASRLSRFNFIMRCIRCSVIGQTSTCDAFPGNNDTHDDNAASSKLIKGVSYRQYKQKRGRFIADDCFRGPLAGWIRGGNDGVDDFMLPRIKEVSNIQS
ncbi:hypothetical protein ACHAWF_010759, partial [Thalassiosira exigua]